MPAGLLTTSRNPSSYRTFAGGLSAGTSSSPTASSSTSSPPRRRCDLGLGDPSTRMRPSAIARWTSARGIPRYPATTASSLPAAAMKRSATFGLLLAESDQRKKDRADHDRGVAEVEDRPDADVDEVDDGSREPGPARESVGQVAERATQYETQRDRGRRPSDPEGRPDDEPRDSDRRPREDERRAAPDPEGTARVRRVPQVEHAGYQLDRRLPRQRSLGPYLGQAVDRVGGDRRRVHHSGRAPRAHRYRGRVWACASLMQRSTYGRALMRAFSMGLPHLSQIPYD